MLKNSKVSQIETYMQQLKLGALAKDWEKVEFINKEQYITDLLELEIKERKTDKINKTVKAAGFDVVKTIEDFVWSGGISIPNSITQAEIEGLSFVEKKENLVLMGAVGTGKTHLATGVAYRACQSGMNARFFTAANLANILLEKNQKGSLRSFLNSLKKLDLMVIDEVGFVPLQKDAAELLFQVVSNCYERRSLVITSICFLKKNLHLNAEPINSLCRVRIDERNKLANSNLDLVKLSKEHIVYTSIFKPSPQTLYNIHFRAVCW